MSSKLLQIFIRIHAGMYSYFAENQKHHPVLNKPSLVVPEKFVCSHSIFSICSMCQIKWTLPGAYRCNLC